MNNSEVREVILPESKRYVHLTKIEIIKFISKYTTNDSKVKDYNKFKIEFGDLREFEIKLKQDEISREFLKAHSWYIEILAYYNRINIPENIIFKLTIHLDKLKKIDNEIMYLEDKSNEVLRKKYHYSDSYISKILTQIIRMKMFYQKPIKLCNKHINEYVELSNRYKNKDIVRAMIRFLNEIGHIEVDDSFYIREESIDFNSKNTSCEFSRSVKEYLGEIRRTKAVKTFRAIKSHLKNFFDFMEEIFPHINKFEELKNIHIQEYIKHLRKTKTYLKKSITPATINARLEVCINFFDYVEKNIDDVKSLKIISKYDKVKEYKTLPKYTSKKDVLRLLEAINKIDEEKYIQEKLIIILMADTGRRFHEVRVLSFSCLMDDNFIYFHKTKVGVAVNQKVGILSVKAVLRAREICCDIDKEIYSKDDNIKIRRLFPSVKDKFKTIVGKKTIETLFKDIQIENGIVDSKGEQLFTLHDNKRNFISNMESSGVTAVEIAKLLDQSIDTIAQYEVRNDKAIMVLKNLEERGILIGKQEDCSERIEEERIYDILNQKEIIERNRINLIEKVQNPKEVIPLALGQCTQIENILICGQIFCMACENYILVTEYDKEEFQQFCEKFYIHMYMYRREERIKEIHKRFEEITKKVLITNNMVDEINFKKYMNEIKKKSRMKVDVIKNGQL
jgi:integrase